MWMRSSPCGRHWYLISYQACVQISGLDRNSSFSTLQQTILLASLTDGLPDITNAIVVNVTISDPGDAVVLLGVVNSEPVSLQVQSWKLKCTFNGAYAHSQRVHLSSPARCRISQVTHPVLRCHVFQCCSVSTG